MMKKTWTHSCCDDCFDERTGGREPIRLQDAPEEICCFCGIATVSGIYVREDPDHDELFCGGMHDE